MNNMGYEKYNADEALNILLAKDEIRELTARYCAYATMGEGDALGALFVEDGALVTASGEIAGRTAIADFISGLGAGAVMPLIHNHVIAISGEEASGACVVESRLSVDGSGPFVARYEDRYRREQGQWRFAQRTIHSLYAAGAFVAAKG